MSQAPSDGLLLILVRHAKSSWKYPVADPKRPLNKRGKRDGPVMAARWQHWLAGRKVGTIRMVVSPARRAQDTARFFEAACSFADCKRRTESALYGCGTGKLIQVVQAQPDRYQTLCLFGHNPTFTDTVNTLCGVRVDNLPTCGIAYLQPEAKRWRDVRPDTCRLLDLDYPKRQPAAEGSGDA